MKKILFIVMQLIIVGGIMIGCNSAEQITPTSTGISQEASASTVPAFAPTPVPEEIIRLAWFYKRPEDSQFDMIAQNFDFFILRHKDETARNDCTALASMLWKRPLAKNSEILPK
jgi:hypothetical protein